MNYLAGWQTATGGMLGPRVTSVLRSVNQNGGVTPPHHHPASPLLSDRECKGPVLTYCSQVSKLGVPLPVYASELFPDQLCLFIPGLVNKETESMKDREGTRQGYQLMSVLSLSPGTGFRMYQYISQSVGLSRIISFLLRCQLST